MLFSMMVAAVGTAPMVFVCTLHHPASRWSQAWYGQDNFAPSRRFREDGRKYLKLPTTGGGARVNSLVGAPAVAKQSKPINSDSLQVQVKHVVSTSQRKLNNLDFGSRVARFIFYPTFMDRTPLVARVFYLVLFRFFLKLRRFTKFSEG